MKSKKIVSMPETSQKDCEKNLKVIYGWTVTDETGAYSSGVKGSKDRAHGDYIKFAPMICGKTVKELDHHRMNDVTKWRYEYALETVFWWSHPTNLEVESVEFLLTSTFKITKSFKHSLINEKLGFELSHASGIEVV